MLFDGGGGGFCPNLILVCADGALLAVKTFPWLGLGPVVPGFG
jgi:hypothetical protein